MLIFREITFDSAHFLTNVPEDHKCRQMHGHTYHLKVFIEGKLQKEGWVLDFKVLKDVMLPVIDQLDHKVLNDVKGLENPTCENVIVWIWNALKPQLPGLKRLELNETPTSGAIYEGD